MGYHYKFDKILNIREREKDEALAEYNVAVQKFEEAAEMLYGFLKKKEDLLEFQAVKLVSGLSVQEIRHNQQFMTNLEKSIAYYQKMVLNARNRMNLYQEKLMEKNIEVKKYEKMKEKDFQLFLEDMKASENRQMDEISIQQYMNRGN